MRQIKLSGYHLFQHTATRRWLRANLFQANSIGAFQHTATRRWLPPQGRPIPLLYGFNTQPPEGGCSQYRY